jgi:hypothetical protein
MQWHLVEAAKFMNGGKDDRPRFNCNSLHYTWNAIRI